MMTKNNLIFGGLVLVSVVVILESVFLIDSLSKGTPVTVGNNSKPAAMTATVTPQEPGMAMAVSSNKAQVKVGDSVKVTVALSDLRQRKVDGVDLYLNYDPKAFKISGLVYSEVFKKPEVAIVSEKKGMVVINYFLTSPAEGYQLSDKPVNLVSFTAKSLVAGASKFEVNTSQQNADSVSIVAEHAQGNTGPRAVPFATSPLVINAVK